MLASLLVAKQGRDLKAVSAIVFSITLLGIWLPHALRQPLAAGIWPALPALIWPAAMTAAAFASPIFPGPELFRQIMFMSVFGAAQILLVRSDLRRFSALWLLAFAGAGSYALAQRLGFEPVQEFRSFDSQARVFSTFGNPDFLGAYLCMLLPLFCASALEPGRTFQRAFSVVLSLLAMLILIWTGSRGAWAGSVVGLSVWLYMELPGLEFRRRRIVFAGFAVAATAAVFNASSITESIGRHTDRPLLWRGAMTMIRQRPLFGFGLGSFAAEFPAFAPASFAHRMSLDNTFAEHAHCEYLNVAAETGVLGAGAFVWLIAYILRSAFFSSSAGGLWKAVPAALLAALVHAAFDRNFRLASTAVPFWLLSGLTFTHRPRHIRFTIRRPGAMASAAWVILFIACLLLSARSLRSLQGSYRVAAEPDFLNAAQAASAAELDRNRHLRRQDPEYFLELGNAYAREGDFPAAIDAFIEANRLSPKWDAPVNNLGNSYFMLKRFDEAVSAYRRALALNPENADARFNLAFAYYHQRKIKEARVECENLLRKDPANHKALQLREQLRP